MCETAIINKQRLTCRVCEKHYHLDCTDVTFPRFRLMTADNKKAFRYQYCLSERGFYASGSNISPLLPINKPKRQILMNSDTSLSSDSSLPSPIHNCTIKHACHEKVLVNVPTANSFQELSHENEEYASITSTPVQNPSTRMEKLREKIYRLEKKLEAAELNIEKLTVQNKLLEKQVAEYSQTNIHEADKRVLLKVNEINLQKDHNISPMQKNIKSATGKSTIDDKIKSIPKTDKARNSHNSPKECTAKKNKHIYIIGDEHLRGLSSAILRTRLDNWNDKYQPEAYIMPNATSTELLTQCELLSTQIIDGDVVILGIGNNDNNIHKLHSNLCIALSKFNKAKIFITPIKKNMYLNETTLNYNIMLWTKHFENCTTINSNTFDWNNTKYINYICKKINRCIDYNRYESDYLHFDCIKKYISSKSSVHEPTKDNKEQDQNTSPKKGTIPYYFKIKTSTHPQCHNPDTHASINKHVLTFQSQQQQTCSQHDNNNKTKQFFRPSNK